MIPTVMKIMVPVSQQDCVFVRKDGLEKTALKVGIYVFAMYCSVHTDTECVVLLTLSNV